VNDDFMVIIGNGPSVCISDLEDLNDVPTFACNSITNAFDHTNWRPDYYAVSSNNVDVSHLEKSLTNDILCFARANMDFVKKGAFRNNDKLIIYPQKNIPAKYSGNPFLRNINYEDFHDLWPTCLQDGIIGLGSVIGNMIQIAYLMGYRRFYLYGVDLYDVYDKYLIFDRGADPQKLASFHESKWTNAINILMSSEYKFESFINVLAYAIIDNFPLLGKHSTDDNYFVDTEHERIRYAQDNEILRFNFRVLKLYSKQMDFNIYNATNGGKLEIFDRVDIENVLNYN
jgi:hypothetical protein